MKPFVLVALAAVAAGAQQTTQQKPPAAGTPKTSRFLRRADSPSTTACR